MTHAVTYAVTQAVTQGMVALDALDLARWQFGITTVYHFFFVPLTIGLSLFVAIVQTRYRYNEATGRAELTDFVAVLTNPALAGAFPHVITSAWLTAAGLVLGVCVWHLYRSGRDDADRSRYTPEAVGAYRSGAMFAATLAICAGLLSIISGDVQGKVMTEQQPMKMAIAEGLYETTTGPAGLSLLTIGSLDGQEELFSIRIPGLLSYLATGSFTEPVEGIDDIRAQQEALYSSTPEAVTYSSTGYSPNVPVTYWSFRFMIFAGLVVCGVAVFVRSYLKASPRARLGRGWAAVAVALPLMPLMANSAGWIFTEMGRQPWAVFGLMTTENAVSPGVSVAEVATSLTVLTLL